MAASASPPGAECLAHRQPSPRPEGAGAETVRGTPRCCNALAAWVAACCSRAHVAWACLELVHIELAAVVLAYSSRRGGDVRARLQRDQEVRMGRGGQNSNQCRHKKRPGGRLTTGRLAYRQGLTGSMP